MPFMDESMLDLFGEEMSSNNVAESSADTRDIYMTKQLDRRYASGCCQRISWSKSGSIAYLSADGKRIKLRTTLKDRQTNGWTLSKPSRQQSEAPPGIRFVHLQWNGLSTELVAIDQNGQSHIFSTALALDRLQAQSVTGASAIEETTNVVGLHWLRVHPQQFSIPQIAKTIVPGTDWTNPLGVTSIAWPHHANDGRSAFLSVTASANIKLTIQQGSNTWLEIIHPIADMIDTNEVLTHAAFADADCLLYLTTYSNTSCLRLYSVTLNWSSGQPAFAQLQVQTLHSLDGILLQKKASQGDTEDAGTSRAVHVYDLQLIPPPIMSDPTNGNFKIFALLSTPDKTSTTIASWDVAGLKYEALEIFSTLRTTEGKIETLDTNDVLRRLPDMKIPKVVSAIKTVDYDPILAFLHTDGSVDFRQRSNLTLVQTNEDEYNIESLVHKGYSFRSTEACKLISISANACLAFLQTWDKKCILNVVSSDIDWFGLTVDDVKLQSMLDTIARSIAIMTSIQASSDEAMALIPNNMPIPTRRSLIRQVYRIMQRPIDLVAEDFLKASTRALRDTVQYKVFAIQRMIPTNQSDVCSKVIWISMNLKMIATSLAQTTAGRESPDTYEIISLRQAVRWIIDTLVTLLDDLWVLHDAISEPFDLIKLMEKINEMKSPAVHLLLSATSRSLLRMTLEVLKHYSSRMSTCIITSPSQRVMINDINALFKLIPFKIPHMESLVMEVDNSVREAYKNGKLTSSQRVEIETRLLVDGDIPDVLSSVCEHLTGKVMTKICESMDMTKVLFWDVECDDIKSDDRTTETKARYDVLTKMKLDNHVKVRTCRRCGSVTKDYYAEILDGNRTSNELEHPPPTWLLHVQKNCVCLGSWIISS